MHAAAVPARVKPLLRGVSHQIALVFALAAGGILVAVAPTTRALVASSIYAASLAALFGISALYHRPNWPAAPRAVMKRLDHAAIFVFIAGTYTPLCLLLPDAGGMPLLAGVWAGAALGVARAVFWPDAPRALSAVLYVGLGWAVVPFLPELYARLGLLGLALLGGGGLLYTVGAVVYARRRPDPAPRIFGYHEVFHALVVAAAVLHFAMVARVVVASS
jgi:hemolysin III